MANNVEYNGHKFLNPYNFVPFPENVKRSKYEVGDKNGYFDIQFSTKTPLILLDENSCTKDSNDHKTYTCSLHNDDNKALIPGSMIRGAIRSIYETITDSCLSVISKDHEVVRRSTMEDGAKFHPAVFYQKDNKCILYLPKLKKKDNIYVSPTLDLIKLEQEGKLNICLKDKSIHIDGKQIKNGEEFCYNNQRYALLIGNTYASILPLTSLLKNIEDKKERDLIQKKIDYNHKIVGIPLDGSYVLENEVAKKLYNHAILSISSSISMSNKSNNKNLENYAHLKKSSYLPCYIEYEMGNDDAPKIAMNSKVSCAQIGRFSYDQTIYDIIKDMKPCSEIDSICSGCKVFGTINKVNNGKAILSKVSFTDAVSDKSLSEIQSSKEITTGSMGTPNIDSFDTYYNVTETREKNDYVKANGRKFYWHFENYVTSNVKDKFTISTKYIKKDTSFKYRLYFNNLTKEELENLYLSVSLYSKDLSKLYCFKLGHAKPLGFGSIKVESCNCYLTSNNIFEENKIIEQKFTNSLDNISNKELLTLLDFNSVKNTEGKKYKIEVSYPYIIMKNEEKYEKSILEWFKNSKRKKTKCSIKALRGDKVEALLLRDFSEFAEGTNKDLQEKCEQIGTVESNTTNLSFEDDSILLTKKK